MTKDDVTVKLLFHGPLTFGEFVEITGWKTSTASTSLERLVRLGRVKTTGRLMKRVYGLASWITADDSTPSILTTPNGHSINTQASLPG